MRDYKFKNKKMKVALSIFILLIKLSTYSQESTFAITNVNVVTMKSDSILTNKTVIISGTRILKIQAFGDSLNISMIKIDGKGYYLMPGLVDGHVHLHKDKKNNIEFKFAPLYLSKGITTVFNMRGDSTHFAWRRRVKNDSILGPTIYTCGEFINEPYVVTIEDAENEVVKQEDLNVDFLKFHEYYSDDQERYLTTTGLSNDVFDELISTAQKYKIPITGHGLYDPNFERVLEKKMSLAHLGAYLEYQLIPDGSENFHYFRKLTKWTSTIIGVICSFIFFNAIIRKRKFIALLSLISVVFCFLFFSIWHNTIWFTNNMLIYSMIIIVLFLVFANVILVVVKRKPFKNKTLSKILNIALSVTLLIFAYSLKYWLPLFHKNTNEEVNKLIEKSSGISVFTTMLVNDSDWYNSDHDESLKYLGKELAERWSWKPEPQSFLSELINNGMKMTEWSRSEKLLLKKLKKGNVNLIMGTDAMGLFLIIPGYSAIYELKLINKWGLSPFETLQTATVNPAKFLNKENEFGVIKEGARADMILLKNNPLNNINALDSIKGIVLRGNWLSKHQLDSFTMQLKEQ